MSRRHVPRAALACTLSLLVAGTLYLADRYERRRILGQIEVRLASRVSSNAAMLDRQIGQLRQDVLFLSSVPPVRGMVRASGNGGYDAEEHTSLALWRQRLESIFIAYAGANGNIVQVRLIGMADGGRELLRVDRQGKEIAVVSEQQLQAKGEAEYMRMTARLAARQVYVSDMNLNREHGLVQQPAVAVLRVATPLYDAAGKLFGILIVNYDAGAVMAPLQSDLPESVAAYLNNSDGDFLLHPDPSRAFGFDRGRRWRWQDQFTGAAGEAGGLRAYAGRTGTIHAFSRNIVIDPLRPQRSLTTYTLAVGEAVAERELDGIRLAVGAALLAGALAAVAAARLYRRQLRTVHEYQARMSAIVESSNDAIIGKTLDGIVTSWNDGAEKMFGYRADEAIGRSLCALIVPPDALDEEADILLRVGRGDTVSRLAAVRHRRDGSALAVSITVSPIRGADARVIGIAKTVRDVSEQVAADERIRALNASLERQVRERTAQIEAYSTLQRAILADAPYSVIATDTDGLITLFNPAAEAMLGYAAAEVVGLHSPALFHLSEEVAARAPALSAEVGELIRPGFEVFVAKARRGLPNEAEWTYVRRDGTRVAVLLSVSALRGDDGRIFGFLGLASDISVRERARLELVAARDQLLSAAEVAELGIWSWNLADNALEWSERMYAFFDVAPAQRGAALSLEHWRTRLHPDDVDAAMADLHAAVAGAARYDAVFRVVHADGDVRHIQAAASIERDANGAAVRVLGVNRDVTAQREAEQVLRSAMQAADAASRAKSEFLANMSHEIRSPMNAVLGMLTLLQQTALDARQCDYAAKAETAGRALLGILNDILDFSRVEAGKLRLDPQPFSVDRLLRDAAVILSAYVGEKDIEVLYEIDPALPDWLVGDAMRLQQVLINLAGNAIKFTERGEVVVSVRLLRDDDDDQPMHGEGTLRLGFSIRDSGIGISAAQCQRIFDEFTQAEASTARRYGGSGLGLAISQRLVRMMGGILKVSSELGKGSVFRFSVTCTRAANAAAPGLDASLKHMRCLVVDDHQAARESMISMLRSFGWAVEAVSSGAAAVAAVDRGSAFDAIFVDWHMPGMDGWEASEQLRCSSAPGHACLIVMVTAHTRAMLASRRRALPAVLDGFLVKPVTASMLFDAVADALAGRGAAAPAAAAPPPGAPRLPGLRLLVVEDNATNQQVARELLGNEGALVTVAEGGQAAVVAVREAAPPFDCVLMDVQMPDMDGYAATRAIRALPGAVSLPILAMTANAMPSDRAAAIASGMDGHIGKPFDLTQLVALILLHCGHAGAAVVASASAPLLPAPGLPLPVLNGAAALARFGGNARAYGQALRGFAAELPQLLAAVPCASPLVPHSGAGAALHNLKGLAATIGAEALAEQAQAMERALAAAAWPSDWDARRASLQAAGEQAAHAALALEKCMLLQDAPPQAELHGGAAALPSALAALRVLLEAADLDCLPRFAELQSHLFACLPVQCAQLESAIEQFNFSAAALQCAVMQRHLETNLPC